MNENFYPVTQSFQRRLNNTGSSSNKKGRQSFCMTTLNSMNPNLAIQSEPNTMVVGFSSYFEIEDIDFDSRILPLKVEKEYAVKKIVKFVVNLQKKNFILKECFNRVLLRSLNKKDAYLQSFSKRQHDFIDLVIKKKEDRFWH